jgi:hypothetical protein
LWLLIGDDSRETTVRIVAPESFDRSPLIDSVGHTILFKHVYVLTASSVFFDEMSSIPSSYVLDPPDAEHLLLHFKSDA